MRSLSTLIAGLLLAGTLTLAPDTSFARGGGGGGHSGGGGHFGGGHFSGGHSGGGHFGRGGHFGGFHNRGFGFGHHSHHRFYGFYGPFDYGLDDYAEPYDDDNAAGGRLGRRLFCHLDDGLAGALTGPGVTVITPDPKTSGNGKLSVLAAWGSVIHRGGNEDQARDFVTKLYQNVPFLGQGARDSSTTFALAKEGDVHLTWENEARREVADSKGELEIVYPPVSILAEPSVTWVDANVEKHSSTTASKAYLTYLFTDAAQEVFAKNGYRPINEAILKKYQDRLPKIDLFPVTVVAKDWADAQTKFFGENGIFETIHLAQSK